MQHSKKNIEEILSGCVEQNRKAQKKLYDLFADRMYAVCLYYTGNRHDAEDILQEGFIKVFENIKQYTGKGALEGWMRKIFVNAALTLFRQKKITYDIEETTAIKESQIIDANIAADDLMQMIMGLSDQYRLVFNLYALEGYKHKEISEMLNISINTSKSNLARARKILQDKVNDYTKD